jgi:hypothetical protein
MTEQQMSQRGSRYHSYLLRLWLVYQAGAPTLHAMLENPHTGSHLSFDSLEGLCGYLQEQARDTDALMLKDRFNLVHESTVHYE